MSNSRTMPSLNTASTLLALIILLPTGSCDWTGCSSVPMAPTEHLILKTVLQDILSSEEDALSESTKLASRVWNQSMVIKVNPATRVFTPDDILFMFPKCSNETASAFINMIEAPALAHESHAVGVLEYLTVNCEVEVDQAGSHVGREWIVSRPASNKMMDQALVYVQIFDPGASSGTFFFCIKSKGAWTVQSRWIDWII